MRYGNHSLVSVSLVMTAIVVGPSCSPSLNRAPNNPVLTSASMAPSGSGARANVSGNTLLGAPLPARPELRVAVFGPHHATYDSSTGGPRELSIDVLLTNTTDTPANVSGARFGFAVHRDGVEYPCSAERPAQSGPNEPVWLAPGASLAYARILDCVIPTLGSYGVEVLVRFGPGLFDRERDLAGRLTVNVTGHGDALPRPYSSLRGLEVALVGDRSAAYIPSKSTESRAEGYHVFAVFVNTGKIPLTLGPMHLSLRVTSGKHMLGCATEPVDVARSTTIEPGHEHRVSLAVTCSLGAKGEYEVTAFVVFEGEPEPVEIGRIDVRPGNSPFDAPLFHWDR